MAPSKIVTLKEQKAVQALIFADTSANQTREPAMSADASAYWSAHTLRGYSPSWFSLCAPEITRRVTGQTDIPVTRFLVDRYAKRPLLNVLEVGCLTGKKLLTIGATNRYGVDVASDAIEQGRVMHPSLKLSVMDLNVPVSLGVPFDVILANGVLHHIENLEVCADWIVESLASDGVLIASEYTGPTRYRYSKAEVEAINHAVGLLPPDLRQTFDPESLAPKLTADPSESIRSRDIIDVLRGAGLDVVAIPYGGNTLQRALGPHFFKHFDPHNPEHTAGLARVIASDAQAMQRFPSHHTAIVATHQKTPS